MKSFLAHVELWLSGVALLIIVIVPFLIVPSGHDIWKATAITAIGINVSHKKTADVCVHAKPMSSVTMAAATPAHNGMMSDLSSDRPTMNAAAGAQISNGGNIAAASQPS